MLEIKEETFAECDMGKIISKVLYALEPQIKQHGPILVGSLNPIVLRCLEPFLPNQAFIPIVKEASQIEHFSSLHAAHYALHYSIAKRKLINELHDQGCEVWAWTVDDKTTATKLARRGIDGLITNHPKKLMPLHV